MKFPDNNLDKNILELIFETADQCLEVDEGINLEHKIVLSIAIRLKAELFMDAQYQAGKMPHQIRRNLY